MGTVLHYLLSSTMYAATPTLPPAHGLPVSNSLLCQKILVADMGRL